MAFNVGRKDIDERLGWKRNSKMWLKCHDFPKRRRRKIVVYSLEYSTAQSDREREAFGLFPSSVPSFGNVPYLLVIPIVFFFFFLLLLEREKNTQVQGGPKKIFRPSSTTFVVVEITFSWISFSYFLLLMFFLLTKIHFFFLSFLPRRGRNPSTFFCCCGILWLLRQEEERKKKVCRVFQTTKILSKPNTITEKGQTDPTRRAPNNFIPFLIF